jgi:dTMP kinase
MGLFVTFEGPDGSGKSTQARMLAAALRGRDYRVTETREPGGTPMGERVRELILGPASPDGSPLTIAFLLSAARAQLVVDVIEPALRAQHIVVCDRFADSMVAYQGYGLGLDLDTVRTLVGIAVQGVYPDISIYVDVEPEVGLARCRTRGEPNRLDRAAVEFHRLVREGYLGEIAREPERWIAVNGDAPPESVHDAILRQLEPFLAPARNPV